MNNNALCRSLSSVIKDDYIVFINETPPHTFSPHFEKKMERLIRRERRPLWRYTNTLGKRLFLAVLIVVLFLTGLFSVSAEAREYIARIIHDSKKGSNDYSVDNSVSNTFEKEIMFTSVPEGLTEISYYKSSNIVIYTYQSIDGSTIELKQGTNGLVSIDTDLHTLKQYTVEGKSVDLYVYTGGDPRYASSLAILTLDQYIIQLDITGDIPEEQILSWIPLIGFKD